MTWVKDIVSVDMAEKKCAYIPNFFSREYIFLSPERVEKVPQKTRMWNFVLTLII